MPADRPFRLRLIHFNDLHGRLADVTPDEVSPVFSRIAGYIRRAREECAGRSDMGVLVLSGGDDLAGSPFSDLAGSRPEQFHCHPSYRLYAAAGVDACVMGNHELDWGLAACSRSAPQDMTLPLLSANLVPAPWVEAPGISPYTVVPVNGLRVGIIGLTTASEIKHLLAGEFEITDPVSAVLEYLPAVRRESDVVVVLSHLGRSVSDLGAVVGEVGDVELAAALPPGAVAVIVGGHTHSLLNEHGLDAANVVNGIAIVQAGSQGRFLGEVQIDVTADSARVIDARLWPVDELPVDWEFEAQHVAPLVVPVLQLLGQPLGAATRHEDLGHARVREAFASGESALANFVADALAARCRAAGLMVDFAVVDSSSVCDGLPQDGALTFGDLFRLAPHGDSVFLLRLPPDQFQALLDDNARRVDLPGELHEKRGFVHFSREVRYAIDGAGAAQAAWVGRAPFDRRKGLHATGATLGGVGAGLLASTLSHEPLLVACSSFLRQLAFRWERRAREQGLELFDVNGLPHEVTGLALREELVAYVRQMGGVTEAAGLVRDGRVSGP